MILAISIRLEVVATLIGLVNCPNRRRVYNPFKNLIELGQIRSCPEQPLGECFAGIASNVRDTVLTNIILAFCCPRTEVRVEESA